MGLCVRELAFGYANTNQVLQGISFDLAKGEIGCVLGASGSGKSTLLRLIAGFESVQAGEISLQGKVVSSVKHQVAVEHRRVGMVFQCYALFPHLTVEGNIAFGIQHLERMQRREAIHDLLSLLGLKAHRNLYPHELSGGQQQRVALARALAPEPDLILMDEPFSSLDSHLRETLGLEVRSILKERLSTALWVTHDQQEAFTVGDQIVVLDQGRVQQCDTPYNVYHQPCNRFVAKFIGQGVILRGRVSERGTILIAIGELHNCMFHGFGRPAENTEVEVLLRPDDIVHNDDSLLHAEVIKKLFRGSHFLYWLRLEDDSEVMSLVPSHHNHVIGEKIGIELDVSHVIAFALS